MTERHIALCYLRLSNRGKLEVSIDTQRARCLAECSRLGLTPIFYEEGLGKHSANTRKNLPQWDALLQRALTDPSVYAVLAHDHERAFRNVTAARQTSDALDKVGVKLIFAVSGEVDTLTASGKMMYTITAAFAEHYSNYVSEKLLDHFETLRSKGIYAGHRAPFGLKRVGNAPQVSFETTPALQVIEAWLTLYTSRDIGTTHGAEVMNDKGHRWKNRFGEVRKIIPEDLQYTLEILDVYQPFLPALLYRKAKRRRKDRANHKANGQQTVYPPLLLRGLLSCHLCGASYACVNQADHYGHMHGYYRHRTGTGCKNVVKPSATNVDEMVWRYLLAIQWTPEFTAAIVTALTTPPDLTPRLDTQLAKEKLERRLKNYQQMLADEDITRAQFLAHKAEILAAKAALPDLPEVESETMSAEEAETLVASLVASLNDPEAGTPYAKNKAMHVLFGRISIEGERGNYRLFFQPQEVFLSALNVSDVAS